MQLTIHTDGGSRGNPGPAAIGVSIESADGSIIHTIAQTIGIQTNNVAEYAAVLAALEYLQKKPPEEGSTLSFYLDSLLVVSQITGKYAIKTPHIQELYRQVSEKLHALPYHTTFTYVPRAQNAAADALVNKALDENKKTDFRQLQ